VLDSHGIEQAGVGQLVGAAPVAELLHVGRIEWLAPVLGYKRAHVPISLGSCLRERYSVKSSSSAWSAAC
jgi:hypothetical protein